MNILLNDLLTLSADPNGGSFIVTGVTGLGIADIRTSSFLFSGRDGGQVTNQLYGFRTIAITGKIGKVGGDREQHRLDRATMINALPIGTVFPVYITLFDGSTWRTDCSLTDIKIEYSQSGYMSDFLIQLTAGDPLFYSTDGGETQSAVLNKVITSGGYVTPYILPVIWEAGGAPTSVLNNGSAIVFPRIELYDEAANPSITNYATGEVFSLDLNMVDGDTVVIDMARRTVTLNGSDIIGNKTDDSIWWGLLPGNNPIALVSDAGDDTLSGLMTWRNGVKGL